VHRRGRWYSTARRPCLGRPASGAAGAMQPLDADCHPGPLHDALYSSECGEVEQAVSPVRKVKRTVTWQDVHGACEKLMEKEPSLSSTVPLLRAPSTGQFCFGFGKKLCHRLRLLCADCFTLRTVKDGRRPLRGTKVKDQPGLQGYLWKLNRDESNEPATDPASIRSWRRRLFMMRFTEGRLCLMYLSEKHDGLMSLACSLDGPEAAGCVRELPAVELEPMSPDTRYWARSNLQQYNVAFGFDTTSGKQRPMEEYEKYLPPRLCPFAISWRDAQGMEQRLVVATPEQGATSQWVQSIKDKLARPARAQRGSSRGQSRSLSGSARKI